MRTGDGLVDQGAAQALVAALGLRQGDLVALVGGGGKTSLLFALAAGFSGNVVLTTTTRIFAAQTRNAPLLTTAEMARAAAGDEDPLAERLRKYGSCLVIGALDGDKARGVPAVMPGRWLQRDDVDLVVAEADGARMCPIKAPANHEPVLPRGTTLLIPVAGIDALGRPIDEVAHRPELVSALTGLEQQEVLTTGALAALMVHPEGGLKGLPESARAVLCINKVDTLRSLDAAQEVARLALASGQIARVVLTSLQPAIVVHGLFVLN